jgi:hypothetical protein
MIDKIKIPYRNPLYWKWMWSMMSRPGESRIERLAMCARFVLSGWTDLTYLHAKISASAHYIYKDNLPAQCKRQNQLRDNHRRALKVYSLPRVVVEVVHNQHGRVRIVRDLRKNPFKGSEKRRVIESPFRCFLHNGL